MWFQLAEKAFGESSAALEQKLLKARKYIRQNIMSSLRGIAMSAYYEEVMEGRKDGTTLVSAHREAQ